MTRTLVDRAMTKAQLDAKLPSMPLLTTVTTSEPGGGRLGMLSNNPRGRGVKYLEVDLATTDRQLQDLAANFPVLDRDRADVLTILRAP